MHIRVHKENFRDVVGNEGTGCSTNRKVGDGTESTWPKLGPRSRLVEGRDGFE